MKNQSQSNFMCAPTGQLILDWRYMLRNLAVRTAVVLIFIMYFIQYTAILFG